MSYSKEPVLQCPFVDDNYTCGEGIQDREVKAVSLHLSPPESLSIYHVSYSKEPVLQCPFVDDNYTCGEGIQDREVKAVSLHLSPPESF